MNNEKEEFEVVATDEPETIEETKTETPIVELYPPHDTPRKKDYLTEIIIGIVILALITGIFMYINNRKAQGDTSYE